MRLLTNKVLKNYLLIMLPLLTIEIIFRVIMKLDLIDWAFVRIIIGVNIIALILGTLYSFCGRVAGNILTILTNLFFGIYSVAQAGFKNYLGVYMSFGTSDQIPAVADYFHDYLDSFDHRFWYLLIPFFVLILYYIFLEHRVYVIERNDIIDFSDKFDSDDRKKQNATDRFNTKKKINNNSKINGGVIAVALMGLFYATTVIPFMQNPIQMKSNKALLRNPDMPNIAVSQFGITSYSVIDLKTTILPVKEKNNDYKTYEKPKQEESSFTRHIDDSAWEALIEQERNQNYKTLSNYFISQKITDKNDYTGMLKNKNLIVIMIESGSDAIINEEYFPNIYKLYNEGWSWVNSYSPRNACSTGNNEMSGMISLYSLDNNCTANKYSSNTYPESLFNLFNNAGYTTSSYHNYTEQYYRRKVIHPNMGSEHYYGVQELGIPYSELYKEWPSDEELMERFLNLTEDQDRYMAWITTVSSHQPYNTSSEMGDKYLDLFKDTNYDMTVKRYMSKLKVVDNSIGVLIDGLTAQGKLDDTVIVIFCDHYPYGIPAKTFQQLFENNVTINNEVDRTPFIIYNSELSATKYQDYTTYINIVPTVANLFGLDYDPRYYVGTDLLSDDYVSRAYFADGSWQDEKAFYNATTGKISYKSENDTYDNSKIIEINKEINDKIRMSNIAIKTNYFSYLDSQLHPEEDKKEG